MKKIFTVSLFALIVPLFVVAKGTNSTNEASASTNGVSEVSSTEGALPEKYQAIITRSPFGQEPENFDPTVPPQQAKEQQRAMAAASNAQNLSQEEQRVAAAVRVSVLNVTPNEEVFVGFTDASVQPPVNYFMKEGATNSAGWCVVSADPTTQSVVLSKNGIEVKLALGEGTAGGAPGGTRGRNRNVGQPIAPLGSGAPNSLAVQPAGVAGSYRDRLRARHLKQQQELAAKREEAERLKAKAEEEKKKAEAERAAMRDKQEEMQAKIEAAAAKLEELEKRKEEQQKQQSQEQPVEEVSE